MNYRWSRIARKLPGRTDNEIKNYWRTHMRKKRAQEKKNETPSISSSPESSSCQSSHSSNNNNHGVDSHDGSKDGGEESFYENQVQEDIEQGYSMDDIWKDIAMSENDINNLDKPVYDGHSSEPLMPSTSWEDYSSDPLWVMDDEENNFLFPIGDQYFSFYDQQGSTFLIG